MSTHRQIINLIVSCVVYGIGYNCGLSHLPAAIKASFHRNHNFQRVIKLLHICVTHMYMLF